MYNIGFRIIHLRVDHAKKRERKEKISYSINLLCIKLKTNSIKIIIILVE